MIYSSVITVNVVIMHHNISFFVCTAQCPNYVPSLKILFWGDEWCIIRALRWQQAIGKTHSIASQPGTRLNASSLYGQWKSLDIFFCTGLFGNDTVVGDPLFTVPLLPTSDSQQLLMNEQPHLCYEIHGRAGSYFNLVSDMCTSVNAYYTVANETSDWNVITVVGVKAVNSLGDCIEVSISADTGCEPVVREPGATDFLAPYRSNGVSVRKVRNRVRVSVPNCNRTNLVMWITCTDVGVYQMLHFTIRRGINMRPSSHGLVGMFLCHQFMFCGHNIVASYPGFPHLYS